MAAMNQENKKKPALHGANRVNKHYPYAKEEKIKQARSER